MAFREHAALTTPHVRSYGQEEQVAVKGAVVDGGLFGGDAAQVLRGETLTTHYGHTSPTGMIAHSSDGIMRPSDLQVLAGA